MEENTAYAQRTRDGDYKAGDVLFIPRMVVVNSDGRGKLLTDHYWLVLSTEKSSRVMAHDLEMAVIDGLHDGKSLRRNVFLPAYAGMKYDSYISTNSIVFADSKDILSRGAQIFSTVDMSYVSSARYRLAGAKINCRNLPDMQYSLYGGAKVDDMPHLSRLIVGDKAECLSRITGLHVMETEYDGEEIVYVDKRDRGKLWLYLSFIDGKMPENISLLIRKNGSMSARTNEEDVCYVGDEEAIERIRLITEGLEGII